jgi:hypothetical protein
MLTRLLAIPLGVRVGVSLWVLLLLGIGVRVAVSSPRSQTVVPIYLAAGHRWLAADDIYRLDSGLDVFRNPPPVAAAFAALTPFPERAAGVVWRELGAAVFLLGLWRFHRAIVPELSSSRAGWWFALAGLLVVQALNNGQVNLLMIGAALNGAAAAARERWWESAAWFGLAGWLKLYPFAFGLLAAVAAPRLAWRLAVVALLGFALPFATQQPDYVLSQWRQYVGYLGADDRTYAYVINRVPFDWTLLPRVWTGHVVTADVAKVVSLIAAAGAALAVGFTALAVERRRALGLAVALGSVWVTAFGPATEANTYSVLAAAAAHLCVAGSWRGRTFAWAGTALLAASVLRGAFPQDWRFLILGPQPIGALLLIPAAILTWLGVPTAVTTQPTIVWAARIMRRGRQLEPAPERPAVSPPVKVS